MQLPPYAPEGEAEATVSVAESHRTRLGSKEAILALLEDLRSSYPGSGRTKEEVDAYLAEERASWDDD